MCSSGAKATRGGREPLCARRKGRRRFCLRSTRDPGVALLARWASSPRLGPPDLHASIRLGGCRWKMWS
eukprot:2002273-Pyramimonas_sp.AAC.1